MLLDQALQSSSGLGLFMGRCNELLTAPALPFLWVSPDVFSTFDT